MKQLTSVLTAALIAAMMLAGCSKDSESSGEQRNDMEKTNDLTKEQIVGVWRSGDYWLSFSEDGFYSAFFFIDDRERIDDGDYIVAEDVVTVKNQEHTTILSVKNLSATSLTLVMNYTYPHLAQEVTVTKEMSFVKTEENPCKSTDDLVGKSFSYEDTSDAHNGKVVTFFNQIPYNDRLMISTYSEPGMWGNSALQYYVYLPPLIYHAILKSTSTYLKDDTVLIGKLTESSDGIITYERIR